jgi:hypothetical protein
MSKSEDARARAEAGDTGNHAPDDIRISLTS